MERCLGENLVTTEIGGSSGGGAQLTAEGRALLARFDDFAWGFNEEVEARFRESFQQQK
jgi:molybdate transport repressor ModE-like protein